MSPFGGVKPSKEKTKSKSPLDQEHNNDARTSYNKDYKNGECPLFVSIDRIQNIFLTKMANIEEKLTNLAYEIVMIKNLLLKNMGERRS